MTELGETEGFWSTYREAVKLQYFVHVVPQGRCKAFIAFATETLCSVVLVSPAL